MIYINDLASVSSKLFTVLFADDTTLSMSHPSISYLTESMNSELNKISNWLLCNRLTINNSKTKVLLFTKMKVQSSELEVLFNGSRIEFVNKFKYLGVFLDNNLSYSDHIDHISSKLSKAIGVMYRLAPNVPTSVLSSLYYALIYPHLIYCNICWGSAFQTHLNKIFLLQKKAVRIVSRTDRT